MSSFAYLIRVDPFILIAALVLALLVLDVFLEHLAETRTKQ
jgi:hypothetical protein